MKAYLKSIIGKSINNYNMLSEDEYLLSAVEDTVERIVECYKNGGKVLTCGNGGSAADAQHIAAEFVGKFLMERESLSSVALNTNTSILTAIGNDYDYSNIFSRQVNGLGVKGDVLIGISTSGNSKNICEAFIAAKNKGIVTVGLTGKSGGAMKQLCDIWIGVPSAETPRIQEMHIFIGHFICEMVEKAMFE